MRIRAAFLMAPGTEAWAKDFIAQVSPNASSVLTINDEAMLRTSAIGIADACILDADVRLANLLEQAIDECKAILLPAPIDERVPAFA
jgi:hypothetical protein